MECQGKVVSATAPAVAGIVPFPGTALTNPGETHRLGNRHAEAGELVDRATIGIKIANGSFFPVLDTTLIGKKKKLVLSPANEGQSGVRVDLFRADGENGENIQYIAALHIESVGRSPSVTPEISLIMGIDPAGNLNATISDSVSGEYQSLSVSLLRLPSVDGATPEQRLGLELEEGFGALGPDAGPDDAESTAFGADFSSSPDTSGYDGGAAEYQEESADRLDRPANPVLVIIFLALSLLIIGLAGYLIFRTTQSPAQPALMASAPLIQGVPRVSVTSAFQSVL